MIAADLLLADKLLGISAIKLQPDRPFIWANGWYAPLYADHRRALSYPDVRNFIKVALSRVIMEQFGTADVVAAVSEGAIAHAALVADTLGMPMVYVRPEPKDHGLENQIEGDCKPGQNVVIVEDQVTNGRNCLPATDTLRLAGANVLGLVAILNYQFPRLARAAKQKGVHIESLCTFTALLRAAANRRLITDDDILSLQQWRDRPDQWTPQTIELD